MAGMEGFHPARQSKGRPKGIGLFSIEPLLSSALTPNLSACQRGRKTRRRRSTRRA
jgi:hypothetical protein